MLSKLKVSERGKEGDYCFVLFVFVFSEIELLSLEIALGLTNIIQRKNKYSFTHRVIMFKSHS